MTTLTIIPYGRKYRDDVLRLMFYANQTHTHLDWYQASSWLDHDNTYIRLAYDGQRLAGLLAMSSPLNRASWLRLAAVQQQYNPIDVLLLLWQPLRDQLHADGIQTATVLVINDWITSALESMGFIYQHDVVTLSRDHTRLLPPTAANGVVIRSSYLDDIPAIIEIDHTAFTPPWQMSHSDIRQAHRQAASATVAEYDDRIIGYQISTRHHTSGHLARLAVSPQMQGKRIGGILLDHLIRFFESRGVRSLTVNTQETNKRSQRLYMRYGFEHNGFDLGIWHQEL